MNVIISFTGLDGRQEDLQSRRPFALQPLATSNILGHILERLKDVPVDSYTILVNSQDTEIRTWLQKFLPDGLFRVVSIGVGDNPFHGLISLESLVGSAPLLFVSGEFVTEIHYTGLIESGARAVFLCQTGQEIINAESIPVDNAGYHSEQDVDRFVPWAGVCWFHEGFDLIALTAKSKFRAHLSLKGLLSAATERSLPIVTLPAQSCLGTGSPELLLHANSRLMQLGYCSVDAIERSYSEEFTVLPPVYLHESAVIDNAIIGPFVNLEAGVVLRNCVVRNSLIGPGAHVEDVVLENSFIGNHARVVGRKQTLIVGDGVSLDLD